LSARATAVFSDGSAFFAFCCCLAFFWVFWATAGFCCVCSASSAFSSQAKAAVAVREERAAAITRVRMKTSWVREHGPGGRVAQLHVGGEAVTRCDRGRSAAAVPGGAHPHGSD